MLHEKLSCYDHRLKDSQKNHKRHTVRLLTRQQNENLRDYNFIMIIVGPLTVWSFKCTCRQYIAK